MKKVKIGMVGLGARGNGLLKAVLLEMPNIEIVHVCDLYQDRVDSVVALVKEKMGNTPLGTVNATDVFADPNVDAVIISSSWESHIPLAIECMEAGKICGVEVAGAYTIEQCWELVHTYERTKTPIMMLENCCYGRTELMIYNMVKAGVFGEIVHCDGGYCHDLRDEISEGIENRHYRLRNYINRNCENYPTHEIGPIARILDINHGNRFVSLSSFASKSVGLKAYIKEKMSDRDDLLNTDFRQGDVVTTVLTCAGGQTVRITLNTTLPRPYSRYFTVHGTKGTYEEQSNSIYLDNNPDHAKNHSKWHNYWDNAKDYREEYEHPIWREFLDSGIRGGHGGMDWLVLNDFVNCIEQNKPFPIDVYDMATWMCISVLSENSIAKGGAPVEFPDFTCGKWLL